MSKAHIVVVGSSLAGVRGVEAIQRTGFAGTVSLVGVEKHYPPIDRPPLSKAVLRTGRTPDVVRVDGNLEVDLRLGREATGLDLDARRVSLDDGSVLDYDGLMVATGATVRRLPGTQGRANVHVLRTVEDAAALNAVLTPGVRVAVIGAGVLGCEIAATCRQLDLKVTMIDVFSQPMLRILGPSAAPLLADLHREHGVRLLLHREVLGLRGEHVADGVLLDHDEVVEADVVVVAIGAAPETRWLEGSGLELADGVACDSECFAVGGDRRVVAAGDVARWYHPLFGRMMRVEHWTNAVTQAQLAGRNLVAALGGPGTVTPYEVLPYFWTDQYDWKLQFIGALGEDIAFEEGQPGDRQFVISYRTEGRLVGVLCANRPSRIAPWRSRITAELRA
ncbi:NAD(P)/FAD-dependent oxidoreductase [Rugosimonospora africana]|uniref:Pyridine nucleotide-disulfide oxidoreductase n=1 Tax=Rugosimonospora africana TaxID=556532 RepID=A0A8J3VTQ3_9ACTN|nr:FAD-dependent oxidoreductase [Rugosimonospora africana]GIH17773.1 pyridine nucleotide-disulfide oxidoreductase [Rugosimonospora africana]